MAEYIQTDVATLRKDYDLLHDEEEAAAQPHERTALIDRDPVERAREGICRALPQPREWVTAKA